MQTFKHIALLTGIKANEVNKCCYVAFGYRPMHLAGNNTFLCALLFNQSPPPPP